jgi:hypothetical protein
MTDNSAPLFSVTDPYELLALWRLVAEAKFHPAPEDADLWPSPYVESLARRIDEALLEVAKSKGDPAAVERHLAWRESLSNNIALDAIRLKLTKDAHEPWWKALSDPEKKSYILARTAPLVGDDQFLEALILEIKA